MLINGFEFDLLKDCDIEGAVEVLASSFYDGNLVYKLLKMTKEEIAADFKPMMSGFVNNQLSLVARDIANNNKVVAVFTNDDYIDLDYSQFYRGI
jgi:hypothetical protein